VIIQAHGLTEAITHSLLTLCAVISMTIRWDVMSALVTNHLGGGGDALAVQFGAFLDSVDSFDASVFGIGRQEAMAMGE